MGRSTRWVRVAPLACVLAVSALVLTGRDASEDTMIPAGSPLVLTGRDAGEDTLIRAGSPDENFDYSFDQVIVQRDQDKFLLRFDLSSIPQNAIIDPATLTVTVNEIFAPGSVMVRQAMEPWSEFSTTWNSRDGVTDWSTPREDFNVSDWPQTDITFHLEPKPKTLTISSSIESVTSPAWVEGDIEFEAGNIQVEVDGGDPTDAGRLGPSNWFADNASALGLQPGIVLDSERPTNVRVITDVEETKAEIRWTPIDIFDCNDLSQVTIRKGDSVLWTGTSDIPGALTLEIDTNGDGEPEFVGTTGHGSQPADKYQFTYTMAGTYVTTATVRAGAGNNEVLGTASVKVIVVEIQSPPAGGDPIGLYGTNIASPADPIELVWTITGHFIPLEIEAWPFLNFGATDPALLDVSPAGLRPTGPVLNVTALRAGEPRVIARPGPSGPIVTQLVVDDFTTTINVGPGLFVEETGIGHSGPGRVPDELGDNLPARQVSEVTDHSSKCHIRSKHSNEETACSFRSVQSSLLKPDTFPFGEFPVARYALRRMSI